MMDRTIHLCCATTMRSGQTNRHPSSVISIYTLFLLRKYGIRASQYFVRTALRARSQSSEGRGRTRAANSGPVIFPRIVQGATFTCGLFRMRLYFPESLRVMKYNLPFSSANQLGVCTARPLLRKVARLTYFWP